MVLGMTIQSWGSFTVYVTSYLRMSDPDIHYEDTAWVTAVTGSVIGFTSYCGGALLEMHSPGFVSLVGACLASVAVRLSSFTIKQGLFSFVFTYAVLVGLGCGIVFPAVTQAVVRRLPKRQGFYTGLVMCGSSVGPMVATAMQTYLVNPDDRQPKSDLVKNTGDENKYFTSVALLDRVPSSLIALSCVMLGLSVVGSYLISEPSQKDLSEETSDTAEQQPLVDQMPTVSCTPSEVLATREFWLMWFCYFLNMLSVNFAMNNVKVFGLTEGRGMSDHKLSSVVSAAALFNGLGRLGWGYIGDQYTFRLAIIGASFIKAFSIATLLFSAQIGLGLYFVSVAVMFACVGGVSSIWAGTVNTYFGAAHFGRNFGLITTAGGAGWLAGAAVYEFASRAEFASDAQNSWLSAGFSFAAAVLGFLLRERKDFWNSISETPPEAGAMLSNH